MYVITNEKGVNEDVGIKYFKECCDELGIDVDNTFCCGSSRDTNSISNNSKYVFKPTEKQLKPQHQYAVKYFTKDKIYLCWGRKNKVKIEKFTGLKKDALIAIENKQPYFNKYSLKRYGDQEKVYVFTKEGVRDFIVKLKMEYTRTQRVVDNKNLDYR